MGYEINLLILVHCDFKKEGGVGRRGHRIREVARRFAGPIARRSLAHSFRRKRRSFHFCFWGEAKSWRRLEALWRKVNWIPRLLAWHANSVVLNTMMEFDKYWKKSTTSRLFVQIQTRDQNAFSNVLSNLYYQFCSYELSRFEMSFAYRIWIQNIGEIVDCWKVKIFKIFDFFLHFVFRCSVILSTQKIDANFKSRRTEFYCM